MTATPAAGMFPDLLEEPFIAAPDVADLAGLLIAEHDEFEPIATALREAGLSIAYVFETRAFDMERDTLKPHVIAKVTKASPLWRSLTGYHLVIQFRRWFWERFSETQRRAALHHELSHIVVDEADDQGRFPLSLRHHDIEEMTRTMRRYGPVIPGRRAFIKAAMDWAAEQEPEEPGEDGTSEQPAPGRHLRSVEAIAADVERMPIRDQLAVNAAVTGLRGLRQMAEDTGITVTVEALGRSVSFGGQPSPDTFGGLVKGGEPLEEAYARLERHGDFAEVIGSEDGQRLLEELNRRRDIARRSGRRVDTDSGEILDGDES